MFILNIAEAIRKMSSNEIKNIFFKKHYKKIALSKESSYYSMKYLKKKVSFTVASKQNNRNST